MANLANKQYPPINKMSNDELRRFGIDELIQLLRHVNDDRLKLLYEHGNLMKDVNKRMQTHLLEIRGLKDVNQRLQDENQEVRDLACFLDDDRQKGRKLAREWQRFGRYTSSVMKSELDGYQQKLKDLDDKQEGLMKENIELKELCLYLDQELKLLQRRDSIDRDEGDGSSSSSPTGDKNDVLPDSDDLQLTNAGPTSAIPRPQQSINEQTYRYIRQLEQQVTKLSIDMQQKSHNEEKFYPTTHASNTLLSASAANDGVHSSRPESVLHAMKLIKLQEQLEDPFDDDISAGDTGDEMDDSEKAIVRAMCNVVWKKLGDA